MLSAGVAYQLAFLPSSLAAMRRVEELASAAGVEVPPAPAGAEGWPGWRAGIAAAVQSRLGDARAAVAFAAGEAACDIDHAVRETREAIRLRIAAPASAALRRRAAENAALLIDSEGRLAGLLAGFAGPPEVAAAGGRVHELVRRAPDLAGAKSLAELETMREWGSALRGALRDLGRAFGAPPEPEPTMAPADALATTLLAGEIGVPFFGVALIAELGSAAAGDARLIAKLRERAAALLELGASVGDGIAQVEKLLARNGLVAPRRPDQIIEYMRWSDAVVKVVADATGPEAVEGALAAFGRTLGELIQALALAILVEEVRPSAPGAPALLEQDQRLRQRFAEALRRLTAMSRYPALPPSALPHTEKLAATAGLVDRLRATTDGEALLAGLKMIYRKLGDATSALRSAVED